MIRPPRLLATVVSILAATSGESLTTQDGGAIRPDASRPNNLPGAAAAVARPSDRSDAIGPQPSIVVPPHSVTTTTPNRGTTTIAKSIIGPTSHVGAQVLRNANGMLVGDPSGLDCGNSVITQSVESTTMTYGMGVRCGGHNWTAQNDFGDVVGPATGSAPDGTRSFKDISAVVRGFQSTQSEPKVWLDLQGGTATPEIPDFSDINFADINWTVAGFQGGSYPFPAPCDCPGQMCPQRCNGSERHQSAHRPSERCEYHPALAGRVVAKPVANAEYPVCLTERC